MSVSKGVQGVRLLDKTDPDLASAVDSSGRVAVQNPPNLDAALSTIATDSVLQAIRDRVGEVQESPTQYTVLERIKSAVAELAAIKGVDGIKKIVDALPTGDNWLGRVKLGDGTNLIGQVLDGAVYRLLAAAKVARGATDLVNLDAIDTTSGQGRLKATLYTQDGNAVAFGAVADSPTAIYNGFCLNGSSPSLLVDGSSTPVNFDFSAHSTYDVSLQEIALVISSNSITFGSDYFGATSGPLANGVKVEITAGGNTGTAHTLKQNEDFVNFASHGGFSWVVSSKDMLSSIFVVGGGLKLKAGTSDKVRVVVRDDIDSAAAYFQCFITGILLS